MGWLPPNNVFPNGPQVGKLKPPCRLSSSGPLYGMWAGEDFAPYACSIEHKWKDDDIPKKMLENGVARALFVGDTIMLKFCQTLKEIMCGEFREKCADRNNIPHEYMSFVVDH